MDQTLNVGVPPLTTLTKPYGTTKLDVGIYYYCTITNCSMHRPDGKKIPFVNSYFKALIQEDRDYLDREIENGNIYIRRANAEEQEQARMLEDPLGVIKDHMRADVRKEVTEGFSVDDLEALLAAKRKEKLEFGTNSSDVLPQTSGAEAHLGTRAIPANETPQARSVRLSAEAQALARSGRITPASTSSLATTAESNSRG